MRPVGHRWAANASAMPMIRHWASNVSAMCMIRPWATNVPPDTCDPTTMDDIMTPLTLSSLLQQPHSSKATKKELKQWNGSALLFSKKYQGC
jgi:hypothetical protein